MSVERKSFINFFAFIMIVFGLCGFIGGVIQVTTDSYLIDSQAPILTAIDIVLGFLLMMAGYYINLRKERFYKLGITILFIILAEILVVKGAMAIIGKDLMDYVVFNSLPLLMALILLVFFTRKDIAEEIAKGLRNDTRNKNE